MLRNFVVFRTTMENGNSRFADSEFVVHVSSDFTVIQE